MFGKIANAIRNAVRKAWLGITNAFTKAIAFIKAHPYVVVLATVPIRPILGDMDFSDITDLLLDILPIILIISLFGAMVKMFRDLGGRLGGH